MIEEWRPIVGYPGYEVSSLARVRSLPRLVVSGLRSNQRCKGRMLAPYLLKIGYLQVQLGRKSGPKYVHELVCEAFHGPRPKGFTVSHKDGVKTNNLPENLAWESYKDNFARKEAHGTANKGERQGHAKLTDADIRHIRSLQNYGYGFFTELARKFSVSQSTIEGLYKRRTWRHIP